MASAATRGGRCGGGVNDATAAPRATRLGKDEGDEDHRDRDGDTAAPDVRRRACWVGADAGRAIRATGATSRGISMADGWGELPTAMGAAPMAAKPPS